MGVTGSLAEGGSRCEGWAENYSIFFGWFYSWRLKLPQWVFFS